MLLQRLFPQLAAGAVWFLSTFSTDTFLCFISPNENPLSSVLGACLLRHLKSGSPGFGKGV